MNGSEKAPGGWTVEVLREHIHGLMAEREKRFSEIIQEKDKRDEQRYIAQQEGVDRALTAAEKAVNAALAAADRAISKAEDASERRLDILNEFRRTVEDLVKQAPTRMELDPRFEALGDKITGLIKDSRDADDRLRTEHQLDIAAIREEHRRALTAITGIQDRTAGRDDGVKLSWSILVGVTVLTATVVTLIVKLI